MLTQPSGTDAVFRLLNGIVAIVTGVVAACVAANIVFPILVLVAALFNGAPTRDPVGMIAGFLMLGAFLSAVPTLVAMTALVIFRARAWWLFVLGGITVALFMGLLPHWHTEVWGHSRVLLMYLALTLMSVAGAVGGLAAWAVVTRFRMSIERTPH